MKLITILMVVAAALAGCAGTSVSNEREAVMVAYRECRQSVQDDPAAAPYYVKVGTGFAHLSDTSRATEAEKPAIRSAVDGLNRCEEPLVKYMQGSGNWAGAALLQKGQIRSMHNDMRLYLGEITWGEYNRANQQANATTSAEIHSTKEGIKKGQ